MTNDAKLQIIFSNKYVSLATQSKIPAITP
jgi:hypothetical protein